MQRLNTARDIREDSGGHVRIVAGGRRTVGAGSKPAASILHLKNEVINVRHKWKNVLMKYMGKIRKQEGG
jgi:hypothetical protein